MSEETKRTRKKTPFLVMRVNRNGKDVYAEVIHSVSGTVQDAERWVAQSKKDAALQQKLDLNGKVEFLLVHAKKMLHVDFGPVEEIGEESFDSLVSEGGSLPETTEDSAPVAETVAAKPAVAEPVAPTPVAEPVAPTPVAEPVADIAPVAPPVAAAKPQAAPVPTPATASTPAAPAPVAPAPAPAPAPAVASSPLPEEFGDDTPVATPVPTPTIAAIAEDIPGGNDGLDII